MYMYQLSLQVVWLLSGTSSFFFLGKMLVIFDGRAMGPLQLTITWFKGTPHRRASNTLGHPKQNVLEQSLPSSCKAPITSRFPYFDSSRLSDLS